MNDSDTLEICEGDERTQQVCERRWGMQTKCLLAARNYSVIVGGNKNIEWQCMIAVTSWDISSAPYRNQNQLFYAHYYYITIMCI